MNVHLPHMPRYLKVAYAVGFALLAVAKLVDEMSGQHLAENLYDVAHQVNDINPLSILPDLPHWKDLASLGWVGWLLLLFLWPIVLPILLLHGLWVAFWHTSGWTQLLGGACLLITLFLVLLFVLDNRGRSTALAAIVLGTIGWVVLSSLLMLILKYVLLVLLSLATGIVALAGATVVLIEAIHASERVKHAIDVMREGPKVV